MSRREPPPEMRREFVDQIADQLDDAEVRPLVVPADVVGLAVLAARQDEPERFGVIADDRASRAHSAVAIDRDRLSARARSG